MTLDPDERLRARVGTLVAGRYRIGDELAAGGMGVVFEGVDEEEGGAVAIKLIRPEVQERAEAVARFKREVEVASRVASDHIVDVLDAGALDDGTPYMVMEMLEGCDLDRLLGGGSLPTGRALTLAVQILRGLVAAHAAGVVHRDLKPANVFVTADDHVKILDFGIAKVFDDAKVAGGETGKLTSTQAVLGSPAYLSPEQLVSSKDVDGRTDIWAMGVILHEMIAGPPLFGGDTAGAIFTNIVTMPIPAVSERCAGIDPRLDAIVAGCLQRKPDDRTRTAVELLRKVADVAGVSLEGVTLPLPSGPAAPARLSFVPASADNLAASLGEGKTTDLSNADTVVATADTVGSATWQRAHAPSRAKWAVIGGLVGVVVVLGAMWRSMTTASSGETGTEPGAPPIVSTTTTDPPSDVMATVTAAAPEPLPPPSPTASLSASVTAAPMPVPLTPRPVDAPPVPRPPAKDGIREDERH